VRKYVTIAPKAGLALILTGITTLAAPIGVAPAGAASAGTTPVAWRVQSTPTLPAGDNGGLAGLSCVTASNCWAVGTKSHYTGEEVQRAALAEHWNGTAWALRTIPSPTSQTELDAVSCPSATDCEAVGSAENAQGIYQPLAERWNGTAWTVQTTPGPGRYGRDLTGLACVSTADCVAVGVSSTEQGYTSWASGWNGHAWTTLPAPEAAGAASELTAVTCSSATWCLAVGKADDPDELPLAESWNGRIWTVRKAANPGGPDGSELDAVTCSSSTSCRAVGEENTSASTGSALAERWNGSYWAVQAMHISGAGPFLFGVSCLSAADCTAVGYQASTGTGPALALAARWDGTSWTRQTMAAPSPSVTESILEHVSCTATRCLAVGSTLGTAMQKPLAETN